MFSKHDNNAGQIMQGYLLRTGLKVANVEFPDCTSCVGFAQTRNRLFLYFLDVKLNLFTYAE